MAPETDIYLIEVCGHAILNEMTEVFLRMLPVQLSSNFKVASMAFPFRHR